MDGDILVRPTFHGLVRMHWIHSGIKWGDIPVVKGIMHVNDVDVSTLAGFGLSLSYLCRRYDSQPGHLSCIALSSSTLSCRPLPVSVYDEFFAPHLGATWPFCLRLSAARRSRHGDRCSLSRSLYTAVGLSVTSTTLPETNVGRRECHEKRSTRQFLRK